jgi:hypothetical protein
MFAKLLFIIIAAGAVSCALLVIRQQRIDTFHEMTRVHGRLLEHERTLWQMRAEIAERCRPSQVRLAMKGLENEWAPLPDRSELLQMIRRSNARLAHQTSTSTPTVNDRGRQP